MLFGLRRSFLAAAVASAVPCGSGERIRQDAAAPHDAHGRRWRSIALILGASGALAQDKISEVDVNQDGVLDIEEFLIGTRDWMDARNHQDVVSRQDMYESMRELYDVCDMDGDGVINMRELQYGSLVVGDAWSGSGKDEVLEKGWLETTKKQQKALHRRVDGNRDGVVDKQEFDDVCRRTLSGWGWDLQAFDAPGSPYPKQLDDLFAQVDVTGDGALSGTELHYSTFVLTQFAIEEAAKVVAEDLDADGDGRISFAEVEEAVGRHLRDKDAGLGTAVRVLNDFNAADKDGDGSLSFDEFTGLVAHILSP